MFLKSLKRGPVFLFKSYELKPITRIVHRTSMQNSLMTSFKNSPPADQQLGRQQFPGVAVNQQLQQLNALWTTSSHLATEIRKLVVTV